VTLEFGASRNNIPAISIHPERLLDDLRTLAEFGKTGPGVNRRALSPVDMQAREWLADRLREAGLVAEIDGVGNVIGRSPHARRIVIGSHTDTVPDGGWLDGAMGVIYGLEVARAFMEAGGNGPVGLEIVSFSDEEACFSPMLGSHSYTGELNREVEFARRNENGTLLADAVRAAGLAGRAFARLDPLTHPVYLEAHIEQGPVLEARGIPLGVVTSIIGLRAWLVHFIGQADHAGTTPMAMRRDAGAALCDFAVRIADFCRGMGSEQTVWNGGNIRLIPGAHNVVPARAQYTFSARDPDMEILDRIEQRVMTLSSTVSAVHNVKVEATKTSSIAPAAMHPAIVHMIGEAAKGRGLTAMEMPSGAAHDAMVLARHVPVGMVFIPSIGGRSHDVAEDSTPEDIVNGAHVLADTVTALTRSLQQV
jgi:N-carbamoyl-L-amino-acid hydrolase